VAGSASTFAEIYVQSYKVYKGIITIAKFEENIFNNKSSLNFKWESSFFNSTGSMIDTSGMMLKLY